MAETKIKVLLDTLKPLMQGKRKRGEFLACLIDYGIKADEDSDGALGYGAESSWKGYANGSKKISKRLASTLISQWDVYSFERNMQEAVSEDALNILSDKLHESYPDINRSNVSMRVGELFLDIFKEAAGIVEDKSTASAKSIHRSRVENGIPFIDEKTNKLRLSDRALNLPQRYNPPEDISKQELPYVSALIHAYCGQRNKTGEANSSDEIPEKYVDHFKDQRRAFYSAEWVKETSWNCIDNGRNAFDEFLNTMYQGIIDVVLEDHSSEVQRLFETLKQSMSIQLDSLALAQIDGLIDSLSRKGACHELVNQERISWDNK